MSTESSDEIVYLYILIICYKKMLRKKYTINEFLYINKIMLYVVKPFLCVYYTKAK